MIHSHLRMRPVRVCIGSSGWWMRGSVQAATSQEMRCWQYIMTADRSTTHTFKHTSYVKRKKKKHAWSQSTGEEQMDQSMCRCREERWDAVMQKKGRGRQGTLQSVAHTKEERGNNKMSSDTGPLLSLQIHLQSTSDQNTGPFAWFARRWIPANLKCLN